MEQGIAHSSRSLGEQGIAHSSLSLGGRDCSFFAIPGGGRNCSFFVIPDGAGDCSFFAIPGGAGDCSFFAIPGGEASKHFRHVPCGTILRSPPVKETSFSQPGTLKIKKLCKAQFFLKCFGGERGIRTLGSAIAEQRFSRPPRSTTPASLLNCKIT
jgi:hypothetical protein